MRLDQLRMNAQALELLEDMDEHGLLASDQQDNDQSDLDDDALLEALGVEELAQDDDITQLKHVSPIAHRRAAEEIANREVCRDFDKFEPIFNQVQKDLSSGLRETRPSATQDDFDVGRLFILNGQLVYIAGKGEDFKATGKNVFDARLRTIYDNGTESNILMRSLQRALNADERGRAITDLKSGPLFAEIEENQTGIIYVLRSKSDLPEIIPIRDAIIKIGVTREDVKKRIANAVKEATYLLGEVEIVDEYKLYNINRRKLEKLLHRIFDDAQLSVTIKDRFGNPYVPKEWYFVPPEAVAEAVALIQNGDIKNHAYDRKNAVFQKIE